MEWISVKDKFPPDDENVIVAGFAEGDDELTTFYNTATHSRSGWRDEIGRFGQERVLFWMPLPTPPKE